MSGGSIDFDTVLDLCGHEYRRIILALFLQERRSLTLRDLTTTILKHNHQMSENEGPPEVGTQIQVLLHHVHIPRLASVGVVDYDTERQVVVPTDQFDQIQTVLATIVDVDPEFEEPLGL